ncbi:autotransporter outer membrane beta-barrel domain-containing protein [Escherichia coli]|uniref:S6 family peptidase n=1 Tax=Escherichia coli TaxID=562 RepID=UPI000BE5743F|nr:S6 family peptidase [Escherichia coli]EFE9120012.1 autotransporter outer membrane beta-barrel domain-containing protein [Escherichia coli]ELO7644833.1 autotransporter outer membrane beta-barrel domain-containing protein [Escherichia coli]ELT0982367.1 autotransporter outer membrane beta-barrel domain-containing protein [Escherichia coli]
MNRVYAIKLNQHNEIVVVSELCTKMKKSSTANNFKKLLLASMMVVAGGIISFPLYASDIGNILPYQTYRDFSQNKGVFQAGASSITLYDKSGNIAGVLDKAPMIDFSSVDKIGVATLVNPQYVVSVKHNVGYQSVRYGNYTYKIVDRNNNSSLDFHAPRLNKIVTEVIPSEMTQAGTVSGIYANKTRFPVFYRVGSGTQYIKTPSGQLQYIWGAYSYLMGGTVGSLSSYQNGQMITTSSGQIYNTANGPMATYGEGGDSGSPLFGFDTTINKWTLVGVLTAGNGAGGNGNNWAVIPVNYVKSVIDQDSDPTVNNTSSEQILWNFDNQTGIGSLTQGNRRWDVHGSINGSNLNNGKNLTFLGFDGQIILNSSVDQGAGSLTFDSNYTVSPSTNETWKGGGIIVNGDHTVDWQVNGVQGDNLHKLGAGTLKVNGTGINQGGLNVGEGTVILAQKPDSDGNTQAFNVVDIVSGRPTVVLNDDKQVNPDNIMWDYRGGKLDINGNSLTFHQLKGADDGAILTNSGKHATLNLDFNKPDATTTVANIWHGRFNGNVDIKNVVTSGAQNDFVMDGGMNTQGSFTQQNGRLFIQGHPVIHAASSQAVANKLNSLGDDSVLTQPVSFTQSDWDTRHFSLKQLNLYNADFSLARNANLNADINADNSTITLGSEDLYIDLNDGNGVKTTPSFGQSKAINDADQSRFTGHMLLNNGSTLNINEYFTGGIDSTDSAVIIASTDAVFSQFSQFSHSQLSLADSAKLTATSGLVSDSEVTAGAESKLSLLSGAYSAERWRFIGQNTTLNVGAGSVMTGNIQADDVSHLNFGTAEEASKNLFAAYNGNLSAPLADVMMTNTLWQLDGQSVVKSLDLKGSRVRFSNAGAEGALTVDSLTASDSQFIINTDGKTADTIKVKQSLIGKNNALVVVPSVPSARKVPSPVALVTAPKATATEVFTLKPVTQRAGVHTFTPQLGIVESGNSKEWRLEGFDIQQDNATLQASKSVMNMGYKNFLTEMNNLNYRMGDLRNTHGETGAWARVFSGTGSADAGYSDSWTHFQIGADRKYEFDGGDLFTGVTATFTHSNSHGDVWSGQTKSTGIGLYAAAMFDSGLYVDAIGKYVHHNNHYLVSETGMSELDYRSHSWYLGAETGWRFSLPGETFIQPQTEMVYGSVSGNRFAWQSAGSDIRMQRKQDNPLIGRTGVESGRTFRGKDWELTTLAGIHYQYDLFSPEDTVVRDFAGETRIKNGKDSRVNFSFGVNAIIKDNTRISLNIERSAFGHYDIDKAINANIRYTF